ncbi:uncharacterized protein A4U43_C04F4970 [Asparagus officinalis]|uniref:Isopenicillin N synthase-like Fe(2+) 2OG dioxygenase domain-containing protein n=1 Tax=Asparagus officinalis TaxID=4686 RepID=A0A5P1EYF2_ASPOF|nr:uncharacterized protein A4U43_C04F4970 [Asparagus officinalis]
MRYLSPFSFNRLRNTKRNDGDISKDAPRSPLRPPPRLNRWGDEDGGRQSVLAEEHDFQAKLHNRPQLEGLRARVPQRGQPRTAIFSLLDSPSTGFTRSLTKCSCYKVTENIEECELPLIDLGGLRSDDEVTENIEECELPLIDLGGLRSDDEKEKQACAQSVQQFSWSEAFHVPLANISEGRYYGDRRVKKSKDQVGGLQLIKDSRWIAVKPNPDALIINMGDLFQLQSDKSRFWWDVYQAWSNDIYRSVMHKVMANEKV